MKPSYILGLNSRSQLFSYKVNKAKDKKKASAKLITKRTLKKEEIPVPELFGTFKKPQDILTFDWQSLPNAFALKPNRGLGGEGIIVVKKKSKDHTGWITTSRKKVTVEDLKLHVQDILEGAYSIGNVPDFAFVEEFVGRHKAFRKYAFRGTPDIRVIVFNKIPIMAMLRLPTRESGGRANLHQGAIAVGVDIATGITTRAYWHGNYIDYKPGTKRKLHGIRIPGWSTILDIAVKSQEATGLGYVGADIVLHPTKGPMVMELNAQPGLAIQIANKAGLRRRLDKVEDLNIRDREHGIKVAKALFSSSFASQVKAEEEGLKTINVFEEVKIRDKDGKKIPVSAKIDTGAWRSSIDRNLAKKLGLLRRDNILWEKKVKVKSSLGRETRKVINLTFWLAGKRITTPAGVSDRSKLKKLLIIGRKNLVGFKVAPEKVIKTKAKSPAKTTKKPGNK